MIIEHAPDGRITHIRNDPLPPDIGTFLAEKGIPHLRYAGGLGLDAVGLLLSAWVDDGVVSPRPEITADAADVSIALGETLVIDGLPERFALSIDGEIYHVDDGRIEFEPEVAGEYVLQIEAWPHLPWVKKVVVA